MLKISSIRTAKSAKVKGILTIYNKTIIIIKMKSKCNYLTSILIIDRSYFNQTMILMGIANKLLINFKIAK